MLHHEVQSGFELEEHQPSSQQQEQQQSVSNNQIAQKQKKKFMPQEYNKAKRTLNKLIVTYFNDLKNEINRGAKLFIDKSRIQGIINAISYFVGVRYEKKNQFLQLNLKTSQQNKVKQQRNGLFSYLAQSQKIINYTQDSRVNVIQIDKGKFKLPNMATPVPFLSNIFLLDPCIFEAKRKVFVPSGPALMIGLDGKLKQVNGIILYRNKCAIVRDKQFIYLLGGYAKQQKILTNRCQKYNPRNGKSQQMINMNFKHKCPTACILNAKIWVFSTNHIEYYQNNQWRPVQLPFGANFLPFQFVFGINQDEILIFGGILNNQKSCQIKIYNLRHNYFMNYGPILPQGICNQRSWGPCMIQGSIGVLSSIQASVYPQIGIKSSMSEVIYIYQSSAYINCILNS